MSEQVSFQLFDLSQDLALLSHQYESNHHLHQLSKLLPFAPFLIKLFTQDSYWIFRLFNNGHLLVLNLLFDLPFSVLKRQDFWKHAWKEMTLDMRNRLGSLVFEAIGKLVQLTEEERKLVYEIAEERLLNTVFQTDIVVDYAEMARENNSLLSNVDFVLQAMKSGIVLSGVDESLLNSREFISKQIEIDPTHQGLDWKLQNKDLLIKSFEYGLPIYWIGDIEPWENDEQVVLKAVEVDDYIINDIPSKFVGNRDFLMKAISLNGMNYRFYKSVIISEIPNLDEFEMELVAKDAKCLKIVDEKFSKDPQLIEKLVEKNPFIVQFLPNVEINLLEKAGQVMVQQFKTITKNNQPEEIKCKDWKKLIREMNSKPSDTELFNSLNNYLIFN
ncbi:predicted protein [Naegleria gruberi]|uniref:Predicted protein n=1 Tax=Naegleria gruberi TaxID=5762 RepID=D2VT14_NAEGR|nr:uncharacterized protein NAEGRDRAFT_72137 [Naegleria gruberi]EFC40068.1 predicted protein [Naegleria gruberi]|eukprot:XP_002672812.1 predicted protein [Naegleria gruberi strain NEG-M]